MLAVIMLCLGFGLIIAAAMMRPKDGKGLIIENVMGIGGVCTLLLFATMIVGS